MQIIDEGQGRTIVFLHGWGGSAESFQFVANAFKRSHRTVRLSLAGFGATPPPDTAWGAFDYAEDVWAALKKIGVTKCILVCHSFGGRVGIAMAARHPEIVSGMILIGSAGVRPRKTLKKRIRTFLYKHAAPNSRLRKRLGSADYKNAGPMRPTLVRLVNEDLTPDLCRIACPTLLVWGKKDKETPLYMARVMHRKIKNSGLVCIGGGHFSYIENPYLFIRIADSFFSSISN